MREEIIFCIDMQRRYERNFSAGYGVACGEVNSFFLQATARNITSWTIYLDHAGNFPHLILGGNVPDSIRSNCLEKFYQSDADGKAGGVSVSSKAPIIFKKRIERVYK